MSLTPEDDKTVNTATLWYDTPGGKRLQYFDVADALRAFKGSADPSALEDLATRLQSETFRDAVKKA